MKPRPSVHQEPQLRTAQDGLRKTQEPHSHPHGPANNATGSNAALSIVIQAGFTNVPEAIDHYRGISRSSMTVNSVRKTCWPRSKMQAASIAPNRKSRLGWGWNGVSSHASGNTSGHLQAEILESAEVRPVRGRDGRTVSKRRGGNQAIDP